MTNQSKKITLIGPFGVGKTSLFKRFVDNTFSEDYKSTLGVQIQKKVITMNDGSQLSLILWDTEGTIKVSEGRSSYLLGTHCFVYVFDLSRIETYENINTQIKYLKEKFPNTPVKILGNKLDAVNIKNVEVTLKDLQVEYDFLASAKTGDKVDELFLEIAVDLVN